MFVFVIGSTYCPSAAEIRDTSYFCSEEVQEYSIFNSYHYQGYRKLGPPVSDKLHVVGQCEI